MTRTILTGWLFAAMALGGFLFVGAAAVKAADTKADAKSDAKRPEIKPTDTKGSDAKSADSKTTDADKDPEAKAKKSPAEEKDLFAVPDGKPAELLSFIEKTEKSRPKVKTRAELIEFYAKSRKAIVEAADKVLASDADGATRAKAAEAKYGALNILMQTGDADAEKQGKDLLEKIKDDKQPEMRQLAKYFDFRNRMGEAMGDPAAADKLYDDLKAELKSAPSKRLVMLAGMLAGRQEHEDPEAAAKSLTELSQILSKSKDPDIAELAKKLEGTVRRLTLMGKPMEIKGTLLDGKPFDQGTLKGKVVLVDFWATWCGPCVGELPNVKKNYEKYHDKGFEVVGVSLDRSLDDLQAFIAKEKITWPILFPQEEKDQFWNNPLAVYYGVNGIPCVILTNQKGEVVSLNARGPELGKKLEELLGKVEEKEAKVEEKKTEETKTPK